MVKNRWAVLLLLAVSVLMAGCNNAHQGPAAQPAVPAPAMTRAPAPGRTGAGGSASPGMPGENTIDDPWVTQGAFQIPGAAVTTARETYLLCEGTLMEAQVVVLTAQQPGPAVYLVASVHGNEIAARSAADKLKNMELESGTLYILSPANAHGVRNRSRYVVEEQDLNRAFPGDPGGTEAERLAHAIYADIRRVQPAIVLDLHEALAVGENKDFLGSSLIYTTLDGITELFLNLHGATQDRSLCSEPYSFLAPGPVGSINNAVASGLGVPVITVETYRAYVLERRVEDQLAVVGYVLRHYGLV